mmetsp:Transcript_34547/g.33751  ORF Transcript_34547/g.33751 Transcript_34547/m.33751 type:complete len:250 (-) Transcript_34547:626-1375(-)
MVGSPVLPCSILSSSLSHLLCKHEPAQGRGGASQHNRSEHHQKEGGGHYHGPVLNGVINLQHASQSYCTSDGSSVGDEEKFFQGGGPRVPENHDHLHQGYGHKQSDSAEDAEFSHEEGPGPVKVQVGGQGKTNVGKDESFHCVADELESHGRPFPRIFGQVVPSVMSHEDTSGEEGHDAGPPKELADAVAQVSKAEDHCAFNDRVVGDKPDVFEAEGAEEGEEHSGGGGADGEHAEPPPDQEGRDRCEL